MSTLKNEIQINATVEQVWAILSDLPMLEKYDPTVMKVELLTTERTGIGAKRKVYMRDGKNWFEEKITLCQPSTSLVIQLTNCTFPINNLRHSYNFSQSGSDTIVRQTMEYEVKFGVLGKLMDSIIIRKQFNNGIGLFLAGLKNIVEANK